MNRISNSLVVHPKEMFNVYKAGYKAVYAESPNDGYRITRICRIAARMIFLNFKLVRHWPSNDTRSIVKLMNLVGQTNIRTKMIKEMSINDEISHQVWINKGSFDGVGDSYGENLLIQDPLDSNVQKALQIALKSLLETGTFSSQGSASSAV
jgi:hypothetical protein